MITSYASLVEKVCKCEKKVLSVAVAHDRDLLEAVKKARKKAGIEPILFGDGAKLKNLLAEINFTDCRVIDEPDDVMAARAAVKCVHDGEAQVLMKGLVNTSDFMRAVLDKETGLRSGRILSHLAAFEMKELGRFIFVTDGGINVAPDLAEKKQILENALIALRSMGYERPNVAVLTANEQVSEKMPATVDAAAIARAWEEGEFSIPCVTEGPIALDVALSEDAAAHKHIDSKIAGKVDLFLTSSIEVGNVLGKCLSQLVRAEMSGVVLGASSPIVLTSRAETVRSKLYSILLACNCTP